MTVWHGAILEYLVLVLKTCLDEGRFAVLRLVQTHDCVDAQMLEDADVILDPFLTCSSVVNVARATEGYELSWYNYVQVSVCRVVVVKVLQTGGLSSGSRSSGQTRHTTNGQ